VNLFLGELGDFHTRVPGAELTEPVILFVQKGDIGFGEKGTFRLCANTYRVSEEAGASQTRKGLHRKACSQ